MTKAISLNKDSLTKMVGGILFCQSTSTMMETLILLQAILG
jgi:hypothetical protein